MRAAAWSEAVRSYRRGASDSVEDDGACGLRWIEVPIKSTLRGVYPRLWCCLVAVSRMGALWPFRFLVLKFEIRLKLTGLV